MSIKRAKDVLRIEAEAIFSLIERIDERFEKAVDIILGCKGKIVLSGMGKPGIIAQKISATLSSVGTPSLWIHPAEAVHGDLGKVSKDDVVICLSNSGETEEISRLLPTIKKIGAKLIAFTGNINSTLAKNSDVALDVCVKEEACHLGFAPTASTTAMLALGDALAIAVADKKGFKLEDYAFFHPGGSLGKRLLLKVEDIMRIDKFNPVIGQDILVKDALFKITSARAGSCSVVNKDGILIGIFTDGDLRRHIEEDPDLLNKKISNFMTKNPLTIPIGKLAYDALRVLRENKIDEVPIVDENQRPVGLVDVQDILKAGLV